MMLLYVVFVSRLSLPLNFLTVLKLILFPLDPSDTILTTSICNKRTSNDKGSTIGSLKMHHKVKADELTDKATG